MLPIEGYLTTQDGVRLYFQKFGSSPKAVIIPNAVHMFESFKHLGDTRTVIFFDLRNRGRSESVDDGSKLARGIRHDVDDFEAVRRHFEIDQVDLIGHSYVGLTVILYALKYPAHVHLIVQIGSVQPHASTQYPAHLTGTDATLTAFLRQLAQPPDPESDPVEGCRKFWELIRVLMVAEAVDAGKIDWTPCDCPNEVNFMQHWMQNIAPSIQALRIADEVSKVKARVLTIHGRRDRQSPYGAGREWAMILPDARLVTVDNAAHVPWIEAPENVFGSIKMFLDGAWPEMATKVKSLDVT